MRKRRSRPPWPSSVRIPKRHPLRKPKPGRAPEVVYRPAAASAFLVIVEIGSVGLAILILLVVGSTFVNGFWCRYLCPYGAFLGFFRYEEWNR